MVDCTHPITRFRDGSARGSWCDDCGAQVLAVHDRQCGDCKHVFHSAGYTGCRRHLMAVNDGMNVAYKVAAKDWRDGGLCWEDRFVAHATANPSHSLPLKPLDPQKSGA